MKTTRFNPLKPRPLVVEDALSLDVCIHWLLRTVFHPVWCWLAVVFGSTGAFAALAVDLLWLLRWANYRVRTRGTNTVWNTDRQVNVLVTGGASGLGKSVVQSFLRLAREDRQFNLGKIYVLDVVETDSHPNVVYMRCDLAKPEERETVVSQILREVAQRGQKIDVLVNDAGVRQNDSFLEISEDQTRYMWEVNFLAPLFLTRSVVSAHQYFNAKREQPTSLSVVTVSSAVGFVAPARLSVYSATKAALLQALDCLDHEEDETLHVATFAPGQLSTKMFADADLGALKFFAPVIEADRLGARIVEVAVAGERGLFSYALYSRVIPILRVFPYTIWETLRRMSTMDKQIQPT